MTAKNKVIRLDDEDFKTLSISDWLTMREPALAELKEVVEKERDKDGDKVTEQLNELTTWLSYSADLLAEASSLYDFYYGSAVKGYLDKDYDTSPARDMAKADVSGIVKVLKELDRRNAALVHTIDAARSQLSYQKTILNNLNYSSGRKGEKQ